MFFSFNLSSKGEFWRSGAEGQLQALPYGDGSTPLHLAATLLGREWIFDAFWVEIHWKFIKDFT